MTRRFIDGWFVFCICLIGCAVGTAGLADDAATGEDKAAKATKEDAAAKTLKDEFVETKHSLSGYLRDQYMMELNGVIVDSGAINFQTLRFGPGNDLPEVCFLPTYTATAWYHKKLSDELQSLSVAEVVQRAEKFAYARYAPALLRGTSLGNSERARVAKGLAELTGLSNEYILSANLRIPMSRFGKELLRDEERTIGRFDSRYSSQDRDSAGERYEFDASGAAIIGPFMACLNDYMRRDLKYEDRRVYEILTGNVQPWSYDQFEGRYVDASETLRRAMTANPFLKLFVACGYYDLATPHHAMRYTIDHLGLSKQRQKNVTVKHYEGALTGSGALIGSSVSSQSLKRLLAFQPAWIVCSRRPASSSSDACLPIRTGIRCSPKDLDCR